MENSEGEYQLLLCVFLPSSCTSMLAEFTGRSSTAACASSIPAFLRNRFLSGIRYWEHTELDKRIGCARLDSWDCFRREPETRTMCQKPSAQGSVRLW